MWLSLVVACGKTPPDAMEPPPLAIVEAPETEAADPAGDEGLESPPASTSDSGTSEVVKAADVVWTSLVEGAASGPQVSVLSGDAEAGPVRVLLRWPAGYGADLHRHTADYTAVVLQGTASHGPHSLCRAARSSKNGSRRVGQRHFCPFSP